jgi:hypothetical protein
MAHEYTINAGGITVAGASTLIFLNPPAAPGVSIRILRLWCSQAANATSAQQRIQLVSQVTAFPTLTAATPQPLTRTDAASIITGGTAGAAGTAGINASAEGAGAKTVIFEDAFNVLNGYLWVPTPRETVLFKAGSSSGVGLFFPVAPATLSGWSFGMNFAEE